jgi:hypothetical protein
VITPTAETNTVNYETIAIVAVVLILVAAAAIVVRRKKRRKRSSDSNPVTCFVTKCYRGYQFASANKFTNPKTVFA